MMVEDTTTNKPGKLRQLYLGTGGFPIVGKRKVFYIATGVILLICYASMIFKGFTPSIEFVGGTSIQMPAASASGPIDVDAAKQVYHDTLGHDPVSTQSQGSGPDKSIVIRSDSLKNAQVSQLEDNLYAKLKPNGGRDAISDQALSGSWGGEISRQAIIALAVFLVLVGIFIAVYFEKWMAVSALCALFFDLSVSAGVYSLVGFEVTPSTVIGLLTILGFSLYDTVIVFDKIKENTKGLLNLSKQTYPEAANLAVNQTLMRSLNTSLISVLPVLALLVIGAGLLGAGTLKDLALVMTIGTVAGTASSIFLATPLLVDLKMREEPYQEQARKVAAKRAGRGDASDADAELDSDQARAMAAAASVPGRNLSKTDAKRTVGKRPTGKRPTGKRPAGKRRR